MTPRLAGTAELSKWYLMGPVITFPQFEILTDVPLRDWKVLKFPDSKEDCAFARSKLIHDLSEYLKRMRSLEKRGPGFYTEAGDYASVYLEQGKASICVRSNDPRLNQDTPPFKPGHSLSD